jgi:death on curing protein
VIPEQWATLISPEKIIALHLEGCRRHGGDSSQRRQDKDCVDSSIGAAANAAVYCEEGDSDTGLILAAYLLFYLARNHCFVDGNKRVAWLATVEVFKEMQLTIDVPEDEAYAFTWDIAAGTIRNVEDVAIWLSERLIDANESESVN